ncbi:MAG TPA: GDSL-type esterase/lipase family protein, partial [Terriglobia bacterium]|nr:GDSL-type esterase/lipase family protein [Terriglobia bacterium]
MKLRNLLFILVISAAVPIANAQDHWVGTWAAAPQQGRGGPPPAAANAAAGPGGGQRGQGGPGAPPPAPTSFKDQTVRMVVHTSLGGRRARVTLSNSFGNGPLTIGSAHVAVRSKESAIVPGSDRALMFNGKPNVTIAQGAEITSDPVDLEVPQLGDLAISVYIPGDSGQLTMHGTALHTTYIAKGNVTSEPMLNDATTTRSWYWISSVDVMAPAEAGAIVAFGDSITDGATSSNDADRGWPSVLSARLLSSQGAPKLSVLNLGISGNRLLADGAGVNALARFDRDVLSQAGVKWLMIMEGINDIGGTTGPPRGNAPPPTPVTADDLILVVKQMVDRAHTHGIKVVGCTLTPYQGAGYYSDKGEEIREAYNRWIRTS